MTADASPGGGRCSLRFACANLHSYVSALRQVLVRAVPAAQLHSTAASAGYRLHLAVDECDLLLFERLVAEGRRAMVDGRHGEAAECLGRALSLWRGDILEDLDPYEWIAPVATRLQEARIAALEDQAEMRLALGQYADLAVDLMRTTAEHPLRERLWGQYVRALHGADRRTDAVRAYDRPRAALAAELGVEPDPVLRDLHRRIRSTAAERVVALR